MMTNGVNESHEPLAVAVGVDLGGSSSRLSVYSKATGKIELHVNRVSNRQTPTVVAFDKRLRVYGEEAESRSTSLFKTTVPILSYIAGLSHDEFVALFPKRKYLFGLVVNDLDPVLQFKVIFDDEPYHVYAGEVLLFYIERLFETVVNELKLEANEQFKQIELAYAIPLYFKVEHVQQLHNFLSILGFRNIHYYKETHCLLNRWCSCHSAYIKDVLSKAEDKSMVVAFLDVGFVHSTFFMAKVELKDDLECTILAEESTDDVGTYQIIHLLCDYVIQRIKDKHGEEIEVPSKQAYSVFRGCSKALKDLSTIADVRIEFERVLSDGGDFTSVLTRQELEELSSGLEQTLRQVVDAVFGRAEPCNLLGIEIMGGGSRIPFIKKLTESYCSDNVTLRQSLDSTCAIAHGSTSLAVAGVANDYEVSEESNLDLTSLFAQRKRMDEIQNEQLLKLSIINDIDKYIIATRKDAVETYSSVLDAEKLNHILDELDSFSLTALSDKSIDSGTCNAKLESCKQQIAAEFPGYIEALSAAELERKRTLESQEAEYLKNKDAPGSVDMDVVLPIATCIKRAAKNKQEGNVLLGDGNVEMAILHYIKCLQYCAKVTNANEEETQQVRDLKLASNLNLSMCYLKLENDAGVGKAVSAASAALELCPFNAKALFRRALGYEKQRNLDLAMQDALVGLDKHPGNVDLVNLKARLDKKQKLQEAKAKKMFSKMF